MKAEASQYSRELEEWLRFLRSESHILRERPQLLFQQAANQADSTAPARSAQRRIDAGLETRVWVKWTSKRQEQSPCLLTLTGHESAVTDCAFSPDGTKILSASNDKRLKMWDALTGAELMSIEQDDRVIACDVSPDGARIVFGVDRYGEGRLSIRDAETGSEIMTLREEKRGMALCAFSPDGRSLLSAYFTSLNVWDLESGTLRFSLKGHNSFINDCRFSPDGKLILSASSDRTVRLWDAMTGESLAVIGKCEIDIHSGIYSPDQSRILSSGGYQIDPLTGFILASLKGRDAGVSNCCFSPDGNFIASVSGVSGDKMVKVWDADAGSLLASIQVFTGIGGVSACVFSPDANYVVVAADETLRVLDWRRAREMARMTGHRDWIKACSLSPDGNQILSASMDNTLKLWDAASGLELATLEGHSDVVTDCAFHPDGRKALSASKDRTMKLWDVKTKQSLLTWREPDHAPDHCAFSPDGEQALSYNRSKGVIKIWDVRFGKQISTIETEGSLTFCSFSADGTCVHTIGKNKAMRIWSVATGNEQTEYIGHAGGVTVCAFSPDGTWFASGSQDGFLKLWDTRSLAELKSFDTNADIRDLAITPDGNSALVAHKLTMKMLDLSTGNELASFKGHSSPITAFALSSDGSQIVSASDDHTLKIWDANYVSVDQGDDQTRSVYTSDHSFDGRLLVCGLDDGSIEVRDAATGATVAAWAGHVGGIRDCRFSPDGRFVISLGYNNDLKIWDPATATEKASLFCEGEPTCSPDGKWMMCGSSDAILKRCEMATGALIETATGFSMQIRGCAFSPIAKNIIAWSSNEVKVWDAVSNVERASLAGLGSVHDWPRKYEYSPDGTRIICWFHHGSRRLLDARTLKQIADLGGHEVAAHNLAFSPDSKLIVADEPDGMLTIWDAATGMRLKEFPGSETASLESLVFSPDGKLILGACDEGTVQIYDADSGSRIKVCQGHSQISTAGFSLDGNRIISCSEDGSLKIWDRTSAALLCEFRLSAGWAFDWVRAFEVPPDGKRILLKSNLFSHHLLEIENLIAGPPVVSAYRRKRRGRRTSEEAAPDRAFDCAFNCPACAKWIEFSSSTLGSNTSCAGCGIELRINPFTIDVDWRAIAGKDGRARNKKRVATGDRIAPSKAKKNLPKAAARKPVAEIKQEEARPSPALQSVNDKKQAQVVPQDSGTAQRFDKADSGHQSESTVRGLFSRLKQIIVRKK